jgi:hypothetical protein
MFRESANEANFNGFIRPVRVNLFKKFMQGGLDFENTVTPWDFENWELYLFHISCTI